jgi:hypothetical protein
VAVVQCTFTHKRYIEQHKRHKQYIEQHSSLIRKSADRAPSLRGIPGICLTTEEKARKTSVRFSFSFQGRDISCVICQMVGYFPHVLHVLRGWVLKSLLAVVTELSFYVSISSFKAFMRGRRAMLCVLSHKMRSLFCFRIRWRVEVAICVDIQFEALRGVDLFIAELIVSVR